MKTLQLHGLTLPASPLIRCMIKRYVIAIIQDDYCKMELIERFFKGFAIIP